MRTLVALALLSLPANAPEGIILGGPIGPGGRQVVCDLPTDQQTKNVGGRDGAGLCVFSSIGHSARWQNEGRLRDFQLAMRQEPGGGFPAKVDAMIAKYGRGAQYGQYEGADPAVLRAALRTGRMPSVTYSGNDPHYPGITISHMVNLAYLDDHYAAVLDNNFPGEYVWLPTQAFLRRWTIGGQGWAVVLLAPAPPPPPHN